MKTAEDIVKLKKYQMISISSDEYLVNAIKKMVEYHIGSIVIIESDEVVGIWT